jgi:glycine/D-amino acid oxidase-like deaminating enzyme
MSSEYQVDIAIVGGGIAGLWALTKLRQSGLNAVLFEKDALGAGQTLAAQGIIHGGLKYSLQGILSKSTQAIAAMPERWLAAIAGTGELDLTGAKVLSSSQYMFSSGALDTRIANFFASRVVGASSKQIKDFSERPAVFQSQEFAGNLYQLHEPVIDVASVLQSLLAINQGYVFQADVQLAQQEGGFKLVLNKRQRVNAANIVLTAGMGNQELLDEFDTGIKMQQRPLHMLVVEHDYPHPVFAHCVDKSSTPLITITSYPRENNRYVWYVGGQIAEEGVALTHEQQINKGKSLLNKLLPWVKLDNASWHSFKVVRAEAKNNNLLRPTSCYAKRVANLIVAWPTKLALAPLLADNIQQIIHLNREAVGLNQSADIASLRHSLPSVGLALSQTFL